jgi:hypothetical protein
MVLALVRRSLLGSPAVRTSSWMVEIFPVEGRAWLDDGARCFTWSFVHEEKKLLRGVEELD